MVTYAHPLVSASLVAITCTVLISNAFFGSRPADEVFPEYKPRPTLAESRRHAQLIGNWVGESSVESGGERRVLVQRFADGTFRVTFKTRQPNDRVVVEQQVGQWGIAGPVYFTITTGWLEGDRVEPTDLGQPYFYDAYRIVELERNVFEYESFAPPRRYRLQRVDDEFSANDL
jgi:hypothetical protein